MKEIHIFAPNIFLKEYTNQAYNDGLSFEFEDILDEREFQNFKEFVVKSRLSEEKYFKCLIRGAETYVRFGVVRHSKSTEGYLVRGPLVTKEYDENNKPSRHQNDFQFNLNDDLVKTKIVNERLISFLVNKNMMTEKEAEQIKDVAKEELANTKFDYYTF
ncbi:hypothetical protein V7112_08490 [Bacillus sp. JJ1566]|uniref:hypothetical protein n=1 Tax=Bacillus sp. JJ1566 TaxID=3122961 RepID=UPI002FFFEDA8